MEAENQMVKMEVDVGPVFPYRRRESKVDLNMNEQSYLFNKYSLNDDKISPESKSPAIRQLRNFGGRPINTASSISTAATTCNQNVFERTPKKRITTQQNNFWEHLFNQKKFHMDRLIKNCINTCIANRTDPRTTHIFHWTIHRCLEIRQFTTHPLSESVQLQFWKKADAMAAQAFTTQQKLIIQAPLNHLQKNNSGLFYESAEELPPLPPAPPSKSKKKDGAKELPKLYLQELESLLLRNVREFVLKYATESSNPILEDVTIRREYLMSYVKQQPLEVLHKHLDPYWKMLVTQTRTMYRMVNKRKSTGEKTPTPPPPVPPPSVNPLPPPLGGDKPLGKKKKGTEEKKPSYTLKWVNGHGYKKFDFSRLIWKAINHCVRQGIDPRISHKFHWTLYRSLQAWIGNVDMMAEEGEVSTIWKQMNDIAGKIFLEKTEIVIQVPPGDEDDKYEYFEDVNELLSLRTRGPRKPKKKKGAAVVVPELVKPKLTVEEFKALLCSNVIGLVMNCCGEGTAKNGILEDVKVRKEFFMGYCSEMPEGIRDQDIDQFWKALVTQTSESYKIGSRSTAAMGPPPPPQEKLRSPPPQKNVCLPPPQGKMGPPPPPPIKMGQSAPPPHKVCTPHHRASLKPNSSGGSQAVVVYVPPTVTTPDMSVMASLGPVLRGELVLRLNTQRERELFAKFIASLAVERFSRSK